LKKILLTAFEPFGGLDLNSSAMVLEKTEFKDRPGIITKMTLPVLYASAFELLKKKIIRLKPDVVVCMGQAGGRKKISIERIAVNINSGAIPDNEGIIKTDELIVHGGPEAYFTTLPYERMLSPSGDSAALSYSAGTYICNDLFYRLMNYIKKENLHIQSGFLHLPFTEHFGKMPYMDLEIQVRVVEAMLAVVGDYDEE